MSALILCFGNRPPWSTTASQLARAGRSILLGLGLVAGIAAAALAQHPRTDPGSPPVGPGALLDDWLVTSIPGLPANATLGDLWVAENGTVYVWASYVAPRSGVVEGDPGEGDGEGGKIPNKQGGNTRNAAVFAFNGLGWTQMLALQGETGQALYGTSPTSIWASTIGPQGEARLYRFDGTIWTRELVAGYYLATEHTLAGVPGDMYFRIGRVILRDTGSGMIPVYEMPGGEAPLRGLAFIDCDHVFMACPDGTVLRHVGVYQDLPAGISFPNVHDMWGMRDTQGVLQLYIVGSNGLDNGLYVWRYRETDPLTHAGAWDDVVVDATPDLAGTALHVWGAAGNDVYVTGSVEGVGHLLHFDGVAWTHMVTPIAFGKFHGVWGSQSGTTWISTEDGKLLRYKRGNEPPNVSLASASVDRLWPADLRMVPVNVQGVTDPDGDAVSIEVTRVSVNEPLVTGGAVNACPDAILSGPQVLLRAEREEHGDGRTYAVEFVATDRLGAKSNGTAYVCVPHLEAWPCDNTTPMAFDATGPCGAAQPLLTREVPGGVQVRYELAQPGRVHLGVYDVAGRMRATIEEGFQTAGAHQATWRTGAITPGIYFVKLRSGGPASTSRIVVTAR